MNVQVGERAGAILSGGEETINLIGYGVRVEDEIPVGAGGLGPILVDMGRANPTILLDSGEKVYGCECWWGSEDQVKKMCEGHKIVQVTLAESRKTPNGPSGEG